jgi:hypothetical protein
MKINLLDIDTEQFHVDSHSFNGEVVYLIQPKDIGCKWTQATKHFRSSVWNVNGELISAGFPKFVNWGENPDNFPVPDSLDNATIVEKIDGSLLIVSKYKGQFMLRTRGTIDASKMENGYELEIFKQEVLPKLDELFRFQDTWNESVLFEWYSPVNRIVIRYGDEPTWTLVGGVGHSDYALAQQIALNDVALQHGFKRPFTYKFSTISDLLDNVDKWIGKEGVVVYSQNGQVLHKIKAMDYLIKHRLKEEFASLEKVLDFYIQQKCPRFDEFQLMVSNVTDFETATEIVGDISKCVDAWKEVQKIMNGMDCFVESVLLPMGDPRDKKVRSLMAQKVLSSYGTTNRASFVFGRLDNHPFDNEQIKKLFWQVLKKN